MDRRLGEAANAEESDNLPDSKQHPIQQSLCRLLYSECHWKCFLLTLLLCGCLSAIAWCKLTLHDHPRNPPHPSSSIIDSHFYTPGGGSSGGGGGGGGGVVHACANSYVYIPIAFVIVIYIVYLVECWHCRIRHQLLGSVDAGTVYDHIRALREALPVVWWKALCYHYVRRSRQMARYRNGDAYTSTQVYYERVTSHVGTGAFDYADCGVKDVSRRLTDLEKFPSAKIRFTKRFSFATQEAERDFEQQREAFFSSYERRDDYMETKEGVDFLNVHFREQMIVFSDPRRLPWYVSNLVFWLASVLLLSWPIRVLIQYKTAYVHYYVHKVFGSNYLDSAGQGRGQLAMNREDTMESNDLEMTIRSNYVLVPSYSEALLMECPDEPGIERGSRNDTHLLRSRFEQVHNPPSSTSSMVFMAPAGAYKSYGTVTSSSNVFIQSRHAVKVTTHARGADERRDEPVEGRLEAGACCGDRSGLGCSRRLRRSYYEAVCFGNGSSMEDVEERNGWPSVDPQLGRSGRSSLDLTQRLSGRSVADHPRGLSGRCFVSSITGHPRRQTIVSSISSPESIAQMPGRCLSPEGCLSQEGVVVSNPIFVFGRQCSWNDVPGRSGHCNDASAASLEGRRNTAYASMAPSPSSEGTSSCVAELPPSYEVALSMEQVRVGASNPLRPLPSFSSSARDYGDDISVSTTSTYICDSVHGTPRHQVTRARRVSADVFTPAAFETTL